MRPKVLSATTACALLAASLAAPAASAHKAHTHGVADLAVAVDGGRLSVTLDAPAADVVGFEHAPRDDGQRQAVAAAERLLRSHAELFAMPPAARCRFVAADVTVPWAGGPADSGDGHADFAARWEFDCADPARLAFLEVRIAARLRGDPKLRTVVLDDRGQRQSELTRSRTRLELQ
jgi:hypothetical protein